MQQISHKATKQPQNAQSNNYAKIDRQICTTDASNLKQIRVKIAANTRQTSNKHVSNT
jgi:hypothetical protein